MVRFMYLAATAGVAILAVSATVLVPHLPVSIGFVGTAPAPAAASAPAAMQTVDFIVPDPTETAGVDTAEAVLAEPPVIQVPDSTQPLLAPAATPAPIVTPISSQPPAAAVPTPAATEMAAPAPAEPAAATVETPSAPVAASEPVPSTPSEAPAAPAMASEPATAPAPAAAAPMTASAPSTPAPGASEQDVSIVIQLRLMNKNRVAGPVSAEDRAAVKRFYEQRGYKPAWVVDGRLSDTARALIARLRGADVDGLDPGQFPTPMPLIGTETPASAGYLATADITLSESIATYVHQAQSGRVNPGAISKDIGFEPQAPDVLAALNYLLTRKDPVAAMVAYNPPQEGFAHLREALATARQEAHRNEIPQIPAGPTLKPGMTDPRVLVLRKRLEIEAAAGADPALFDPDLTEAVAAFQKDSGLKPDGMVGAGTVAKLNQAGADPTPVIISNMERWRWLPRDLGRFYVNVNVPQFEAVLHRDGEIIHTTRIIVGKPQNKTPVFSDEIEHVIVNPYWHVPASITAKEMLPQIMADPSSLTRQNYEVFANVGGRFREVDPMLVDWYTVNPKQIQIRQRPGDDNALGHIKFMFPNKYDVYLHDTPTKSLFQRDYRAFSHGCMRVMNPLAFAGALLSEEPVLTVAKIKKLIGGAEQRLDMAKHVPVHITYFTAWVDEDGKLRMADDIYGYDAKVRKALGL